MVTELNKLIRTRSAKRKNRYPELFKYLSNIFSEVKILSYGCGYEEPFTLADYFVNSDIVGCDVKSKVIERCKEKNDKKNLKFITTKELINETPSSFDIIFALNVFKRLRLSEEEMEEEFPISLYDKQVSELDQFLDKGGLLVLIGCTYSFLDTKTSKGYNVYKQEDNVQFESKGEKWIFQKKM